MQPSCGAPARMGTRRPAGLYPLTRTAPDGPGHPVTIPVAKPGSQRHRLAPVPGDPGHARIARLVTGALAQGCAFSPRWEAG